MDSIYLGCIFSCESLSLTDGIGINIKAQSQMQLINFGEVVFKSDIYGGVEIKLVDFGVCDPISWKFGGVQNILSKKFQNGGVPKNGGR